MNPLVKIAVIVVIIGCALFGAYSFGGSVEHTAGQLVIAKLQKNIADQNTEHATEREQLLAQVRDQDRANIERMADIDQQHQKAIENEKAIADRTIADLRSGAIRLRDKFAANEFIAAGGIAAPGTCTGCRDAAASIRLQSEDAGFLVRLASEADQVADQLRACQAVVVADRVVKP